MKEKLAQPSVSEKNLVHSQSVGEEKLVQPSMSEEKLVQPSVSEGKLVQPSMNVGKLYSTAKCE